MRVLAFSILILCACRAWGWEMAPHPLPEDALQLSDLVLVGRVLSVSDSSRPSVSEDALPMGSPHACPKYFLAQVKVTESFKGGETASATVEFCRDALAVGEDYLLYVSKTPDGYELAPTLRNTANPTKQHRLAATEIQRLRDPMAAVRSVLAGIGFKHPALAARFWVADLDDQPGFDKVVLIASSPRPTLIYVTQPYSEPVGYLPLDYLRDDELACGEVTMRTAGTPGLAADPGFAFDQNIEKVNPKGLYSSHPGIEWGFKKAEANQCHCRRGMIFVLNHPVYATSCADK